MSDILKGWKEKILDKGRSRWLLLLLFGLLLLVIALPVSSDSTKETSGSDFSWDFEKTETVEKTLLEEKLTEILESVEGVGRVRVMLMTGEEDNQAFYSSQPEKVTGVLISAEGGDNFVTVKNIQEAVMALFQIDAHKIKVMKMK